MPFHILNHVENPAMPNYATFYIHHFDFQAYNYFKINSVHLTGSWTAVRHAEPRWYDHGGRSCDDHWLVLCNGSIFFEVRSDRNYSNDFVLDYTRCRSNWPQWRLPNSLKRKRTGIKIWQTKKSSIRTWLGLDGGVINAINAKRKNQN